MWRPYANFFRTLFACRTRIDVAMMAAPDPLLEDTMQLFRGMRLCFLLLLIVPALAGGEVVKLKDDSTVRGRLVQVDGDTLVFRSTFGTLRFHRDQVVSIVFDDSAWAEVTTGVPVPGSAGVVAPGGKSRIQVSFKDRMVSSKISIDLKKDWDEHIASNAIVVEFFVDGKLAYSAIDSTMDKRIYKGHKTVMKNNTELADFGVEVASGYHTVRLVVRNADCDTYREFFDPAPIDMVLAMDDLDIRPGGTYRLDVGISKGALRLGQPQLIHLD